MATQYSTSWIPRSFPCTSESKTSPIVLTTAQTSLSRNSPPKDPQRGLSGNFPNLTPKWWCSRARVPDTHASCPQSQNTLESFPLIPPHHSIWVRMVNYNSQKVKKKLQGGWCPQHHKTPWASPDVDPEFWDPSTTPQAKLGILVLNPQVTCKHSWVCTLPFEKGHWITLTWAKWGMGPYTNMAS